MDLLLIIILSLVLVPIVFLTSGPLRIALGLLLIIFLPGYALIAALFPKKDTIDNVHRLAFSFGTSIVVVPLIGFILNYTPLGIRLQPILFSLLGFILLMAALAQYRRWKLPPGERFKVNLRLVDFLRLVQGWRNQKLWDKILSLLLVAAMGGVIATTLYMLPTTGGGEAFSEFFVLGPEGKAEDYPGEITLGEKGEVILKIINHEHEAMVYRVEIKLNGEKVEEISPIALNDEEEWEQEVSFTPIKLGQNQKVAFWLYRDEDREPYLVLYLRFDVVEKLISQY